MGQQLSLFQIQSNAHLIFIGNVPIFTEETQNPKDVTYSRWHSLQVGGTEIQSSKTLL